MKIEKLYDESTTKEEAVTLLINWAEKALVHNLVAEGRAITDEIEKIKAMTDAEFSEYLSLDLHGIVDTVDVVNRRVVRHELLTKGLSHPLDDSSRILGTNINGRPLNGFVPNDCGSRLYMFGETAKEVVTQAISNNELPTGAEGNKADLLVHHIPISKALLDSFKHHPSIVNEQYKAIHFTCVHKPDMAQRLITDLQYILEHTADDEYGKVLSAEIQRLTYMAKGEITQPSDVEYKWVQDRHLP